MTYFNESTQPDIDQELQEKDIVPIIEIEVKDRKTGWKGQISGELMQNFDNNTLWCQRQDVSSEEEEESEQVASSYIVIDHDLSAKENLQLLYNAVIKDIINGDLFDLV